MSNKPNKLIVLTYDLFGRLVVETDLPPQYQQTLRGMLHYIRDHGCYTPEGLADALGTSRRTIEGYRAAKPIPPVMAWKIRALIESGNLTFDDDQNQIPDGAKNSTPSETATRGGVQQTLGLLDEIPLMHSSAVPMEVIKDEDATNTSKATKGKAKDATSTSKATKGKAKDATNTSKATKGKAKSATPKVKGAKLLIV